MKIVKATRKGETTIPAEIKEKLGIKEGNDLAVECIDQQASFQADT